MNKKQVTCSALAAMMFAGTTGFTAFAAMPDATVLIKDKAYALDYAENTANRAEIIKQLGQLTEGEQAILKLNNKWLNNDKTAADTTKIPAVTYKDADGKETKYEAQDGVAVEEGDFKVVEISAVGAKKLQVNFNKPVEDASKLTYSIKRDGANVTLAKDSAVWNEDKTQVTLETSYALMTGNYVMTAKYADGEEVKAEAKIEAAKVSTVEIDDNAIMSLNTDGSMKFKEVVVKVDFFNQYGEKVKPTGNVSVSPKYNDNCQYKDGYVTIQMDSSLGFRIGEKFQVAVTMIDNTNVVTGSKEVTVAEPAQISSLEIGAITTDNKDYKDKDIFVSSLSKADYYMPITAKDQYGNEIKEIKAQGPIGVSNNAVEATLEVKDGKSYIKIARAQKEGKDVPVSFVGKVNLTLVAGTKVASTDFELKYDPAVAQIKFNQPEEVLRQGQSSEITFSAIDQYGNELKLSKDLVISPVGKDADKNPIEYIEGTPVDTLKLKGIINGVSQDVTLTVANGQISADTDYNKDGAFRVFKLHAAADARQVILNVIASSASQTMTVNTVQASEAKSITQLELKDEFVKLEKGSEATLLIKVNDQYDLVYTKDPKNSEIEYKVDKPGVSVQDGKVKVTSGAEPGIYTIKAITGTKKDVEKTLKVEVVKEVKKFGLDLDKETLYVGKDHKDDHNIKVSLIGYVDDQKVKLADDKISRASETMINTAVADVTTDNGISFNGSAQDGNMEVKAVYTAKVRDQIMHKEITISNKARDEKELEVLFGREKIEGSSIAVKASEIKDIQGRALDQYKVDMGVRVMYNKEIDKVTAGDKVTAIFTSPAGKQKTITIVVKNN